MTRLTRNVSLHKCSLGSLTPMGHPSGEPVLMRVETLSTIEDYERTDAYDAPNGIVHPLRPRLHQLSPTRYCVYGSSIYIRERAPNGTTKGYRKRSKSMSYALGYRVSSSTEHIVLFASLQLDYNAFLVFPSLNGMISLP